MRFLGLHCEPAWPEKQVEFGEFPTLRDERISPTAAGYA